MSNVKDVYIEAEVPWNWITELDANQASLFHQIGLNPVFGLRAHFTELGYRDNEYGGKTSMYKMVIEGIEAVSYGFIDAMIEALNSLPEGKVLDTNGGYDLETHGR